MKKHKYELIDVDFLPDVADVLEDGIKNGRVADSWKTIPWDGKWERYYSGRIISHIVKLKNSPEKDKARHCASIAANAMIIAWHSKRNDATVKKYLGGTLTTPSFREWCDRILKDGKGRVRKTLEVSPTAWRNFIYGPAIASKHAPVNDMFHVYVKRRDIDFESIDPVDFEPESFRKDKKK